jgi:hypothetical protein
MHASVVRSPDARTTTATSVSTDFCISLLGKGILKMEGKGQIHFNFYSSIFHV